MSNQYPEVGALYHHDGRTSFAVWAPTATKVTLALNGRSIPMTNNGIGYWQVTVNSTTPGDTYKFEVDSKGPRPDPASRSQPDGVHGASQVVDRDFLWTDAEWKGLAMRDLIIYELHTGVFTPDGTFDGIRSRLSYLRDVGINAIELMPIAQFPGSRNWGYDGVFPFAVQNTYGGVRGLKQLVDDAHRHGIAVILDVVYNHLGPEGNYLGDYGPYFTDKYRSFWGQALNYDDAWCDGVRNFFLQNALMWLGEFHIDGLRLDAVHAIWDFGAVHFVEALAEAVDELERRTGRQKLLIAEIDLNNPRYIAPREAGGYGLDAQWIDEFHHALRALVTGETDGYYEDFGSSDHFRAALKDSYVYSGAYSIHRKKNFGRSAALYSYDRFVVFGQNHDQVGNRLLGDRLSTKLSFEALKLVAGAVLLSPHVPMLFMGEEYIETNPFQYFISHTDETLVQQVREGRKNEFSYFNWEGPVPDPQSEDTFRQCILSWRDDTRSTTMLSFYRALIDFRRNRRAMKGAQRSSIYVYPEGGERVVGFERSWDGDRIAVVMNFSRTGSQFTLPQPGKRIFDSAWREWNGPLTRERTAATEELNLMPQSFAIVEM